MKHIITIVTLLLFSSIGYSQFGYNIAIDPNTNVDSVQMLLSVNGRDHFTGRKKRLNDYERKGYYASVSWEKVKSHLLAQAATAAGTASDAVVEYVDTTFVAIDELWNADYDASAGNLFIDDIESFLIWETEGSIFNINSTIDIVGNVDVDANAPLGRFRSNAGGGELRLDGGTDITTLTPGTNGLIITLAGIPTYADDTAAGVGGLTAGAIYKTAAGALMIKL